MARESTITFEQVSVAADNILAQSLKPTARNVREVLGTGSMATILKFLQQWQSGQARQSQAIDDTLDNSIVRAISNEIASKVQEATSEARAKLADLQAETDNLINENESQATELNAKVMAFTQLQEQHSALAGRAEQLEDEIKRTAAALLSERQASEIARVALAKAELRLEALPGIEAEIDKVRLELANERNKSSELHEAAAVANAKLEGELALKLSLQEQLLKITKTAEDNAERAIKATEQLSNEKVLTQTFSTRIDNLTRELLATQETAKTAGELAAEFKGQLSVIQKSAPLLS